MEFVQIATSIERGAYYYDISTDNVYHVPHEELLEMNNVRSIRLLVLLACSIFVVTMIVEYVSSIQYMYDTSLPLLLLMTIVILSSCMFYWLVKRHQKKIFSLIQNKYPVLSQEIDLMEEIKLGCKTYFQLGIYIIFLFCTAIISLKLRSESPDILLDIFSVAFLNTSIMMIAILQPLGKVRVYLRIHNRGL